MKRDPLIGKKLANFLVDRPIGRGGMAQIYYGVDTALERPVAIKVIDARFQGDPEYAKRFVDEAKIVARWKHPNIVSVYYADNEDDVYYFAMEYIDGVGLDELLESYFANDELMPHADVLRIGKDMAKALDYAHKQGVVHRDFKPSNVMISRDDRVILADFGLALDINQGSMGQIFGTPHYIAPEQARRSSDAVPQSDIYALGVVMYEMLAGTVPFDDESAMAVAVQHMSEPPPAPTTINPALSQAVEDVLLKALEKEPQDRYQSGAELMQALENALNRKDTQTVAKESPAIMPPAAISGGRQSKKLSQMSISDMLSAELEKEEPETQQAFRAARSPKPHEAETKKMRAPQVTQASQRTAEVTQVADKRKKEKEAPSSGGGNKMVFVGIAAIIVIVVIAGAIFMMMGGGDNSAQVVVDVTEAPTLDDGMAETSIAATSQGLDLQATQLQETNAAQVVPTNTVAPVVPTNTVAPPTDDPAPALTNQAQMDMLATQNMQTQDALIQATFVAQTQSAQAAQAPVEPTIVFANGRPIEMSYNSAGFYLRNNGTESNIRMSRLAFRALTADGSQTGHAFDGSNWARFYNFIDRNGRCVAIELTDQPSWSRPTNCVPSAGNAFNSLLTFMDVDQQIFWLPQNGATQFAVLWDGAEIARCPLADGACQVNVGE